MQIWAHTMVKNEARWLWYSVSSVVNYVDKILLWDMGSTDGTIEIEKELVKQYPDKVIYKQRNQNTPEEFTLARQEMLDETKSDWLLMLDGDEIWWQDSIRHLLSEIKKVDTYVESIVVPTINLVGDVFHYLSEDAGMYKFGNLKGHYNLRAIKRNIPGLHSQGLHGVWGWADNENKMIQDRNTFKFIKAPYIHATNIVRSLKDMDVIKRHKKIKYELGKNFAADFYYPEAFFKDKPNFILSPWGTMSANFKHKAFIETPLRKIKRKIWKEKIGY